MRLRTIGVSALALAAGLVGLLLLSSAATADEAERGGVARIAVDIDGTGSGRIVSSPGAIDCPPDCISPAEIGTSYTLTAIPDEGSVLVGFGGACDSSTATTCTFTAQPNTNIYNPVFDKDSSGGGKACDKAKAKLAKAKAKLKALKADGASSSSVKKAKKKVKRAKAKVKKAC